MSKKTVYIHIGSDKTGSTAIQAFAFHNAAILESRGLHVVSSKFNHHGPICDEITAGDHALLDKAVEEIRNSACPRHLLTFEGLYHLKGRDLQALLRPLHEFDVKVIFYVRLRSDKFRSGIAQNLKINKAEHAENTFNVLFRKKFPDRYPSFDYLAIVRRWQDALERSGWAKAFDLRVYEKSSFVGGDLVMDFFSRLGVVAENEAIYEPPFKKLPDVVNPSISPAAQYIMALAYLLGHDDRQRRLVRELIFANDDPDDTKSSLVPDDIALAWDERFAQEDKELAREFFGRDKLFKEGPKFRHGVPKGEAFVKLVEALYAGRDQLLLNDPSRGMRQPKQEDEKKQPNEFIELIKEADSKRKSGDQDGALRVLQGVLERKPKQVKANYLVASIFFDRGDEETGKKYLTTALQESKILHPWLKELADQHQVKV